MNSFLAKSFSLIHRTDTQNIADFHRYKILFPYKPRFMVNEKYVLQSIFFIAKYIHFGRKSIGFLSVLCQLILKPFVNEELINTPIIFISNNGKRNVNIMFLPKEKSVRKYVDYGSSLDAEIRSSNRKKLKCSFFGKYSPDVNFVRTVGSILETEEELLIFKRIWFKVRLIPPILSYFKDYFHYVDDSKSNGEDVFWVHGDLAYWNIGIEHSGRLRIFDFDDTERTSVYEKDFLRFFETLPISPMLKKIIIKRFIRTLPLYIKSRLHTECSKRNLI